MISQNKTKKIIKIKLRDSNTETKIVKLCYKPLTEPTILYKCVEESVPHLGPPLTVSHVHYYTLDSMVKCYVNEFKYYIARKPKALSLMTKFVEFINHYDLKSKIYWYQRLFTQAQSIVVMYKNSFEGFGVKKEGSNRYNLKLNFEKFADSDSLQFSPKEGEKYTISLITKMPNYVLKKTINSMLQKRFFAPRGIEDFYLQKAIYELQGDLVNLVMNNSEVLTTNYFEYRSDFMYRQYLTQFFRANFDTTVDKTVFNDFFENTKEYRNNLIINFCRRLPDTDYENYFNKVSDTIFNALTGGVLLKKYISVFSQAALNFKEHNKFRDGDFDFTAYIEQFNGSDYVRDTRYYKEYRTFVTLGKHFVKIQRNFIRMKMPSNKEEWFELIRVRLPVKVNGIVAFDITLLDIIIFHKKSDNANESEELSQNKNSKSHITRFY